MSAKSSLVLLPGLNCTQKLWQAQIVALSDVAEVFVPDVSTHDAIGALANAVLREAPPRFALAGLSMGGYVALEIMRQAPERVERLALVDTQARPDEPDGIERRRALIEVARAGRFSTILPTLWARLVATTRLSDAGLEAVVTAMALETGADGFMRQQTLILGRPDSRPDLPHIRCPTLVVVGDDDRITPPSVAVEMAQAIPGATLRVIPDCGHLAPLEQPTLVAEVMRDWLVASSGITRP